VSIIQIHSVLLSTLAVQASALHFHDTCSLVAPAKWARVAKQNLIIDDGMSIAVQDLNIVEYDVYYNE